MKKGESEMKKKILIAGITGLIGKKLVVEFKKDYNVCGIVRDKTKAQQILSDVELFQWNDDDEKLLDLIAESSVVINLSGRSIAKGRWTDKAKSEIFNSRINSTKKLAELILKSSQKPELFLVASAVGYYGLDIHKISDENSPPSDDFLGKVCVEWEKASSLVDSAGIRRVNIRISTVLSLDGGALPLLSLPFKFFIGNYFGSGEQYFPWIHEKDLVRLFRFVIENKSFSGPINAVSPHSVTAKEFCLTLGKVLKRPCILGIPEWIVKIFLGEMGEILTKGGKVIPQKLLDAGFKFEFDDLDKALKDLFKK